MEESNNNDPLRVRAPRGLCGLEISYKDQKSVHVRIDYMKIILLKIAHLTIFHTFRPASCKILIYRVFHLGGQILPFLKNQIY